MTLTDTPESLEIRAELPETRESSDALELVEAKILRGFSLEFVALRERMEGPTRVLVSARLVGLAVVDKPAYQAKHDISAGRSRTPGALGVNPVSLRTWWESRAAPTPTDYTSLRIADATARVSGEQGARGTAVFRACQGLIARSVAAAVLEGEFSESLGPRLSEIARALTDCGESTWEIRLGPNGLTLLPCKISTVTGAADPKDWRYLLTRAGPSENIVIERPAEAVLSFKVNAEPGSPYRGVAPLEVANSTGSLLASLGITACA